MARYFFSLEDGRQLAEDEGEELANDEAAREVGLEIARDWPGISATPMMPVS
jgi:hypothetical protein